ncbi:MAG: OmpH family outer membrane protein [Spirochaetales bacterium]|nr:OmpH family outer membrane protein [Spirochaetales bacterium]
MKNMRVARYCVLSLVFFLIGITLFANQNMPKVGVVNIKKIAQTYFRDSKAFRDLQEEKEKNEKYIEQVKKDIQNIEKQILEANMANNYDLGFRLESEKKRKVEHLREYIRITNQQIEEKLKKLYYSDEYLEELIEKIEMVALKQGFSLILDIDSSEIYFYTQEIDITELVIEELMTR